MMSRFSMGLVAICLCVFTASSAVAQADMGFKAVGARIGYVSPEDLDGTVGFGAFVNLGTIVPNLTLETGIGYWSASTDEAGADVSVSDFIIGGKVRYGFVLDNSKISPFVGGGLGLHFVSAEVSTPFGSADDSETKFGIDLGGGAVFPMSPQWDFITDAWFTIVSDANQFSINVGVEYNLGN